MKKIIVWYYKQDGDDTQTEVEANIVGPLAVHKHLSGRAGWWSISHVAKGYTLDQVPFTRKQDAMQAARALAAKPEVWENLDKPHALEEACQWYVQVMDELGFRRSKYTVDNREYRELEPV